MVKEMTLSERFCDLLRRNEVEVGVLRLLNYKYCAVAIGNRICSTSSPFAVSLLLINYCDRIEREETHRGNDETWLSFPKLPSPTTSHPSICPHYAQNQP